MRIVLMIERTIDTFDIFLMYRVSNCSNLQSISFGGVPIQLLAQEVNTVHLTGRRSISPKNSEYTEGTCKKRTVEYLTLPKYS